MLKKIATFLLLTFLVGISYAFDTPWIVHYTKGKVTHTQAEKIVSAVHRYSHKHQVNPDVVFKIIQTESSYNPKARGGSSVGLMQIIPRWHKDKIKGRNLYNVDTNVEVGVKILKEHLEDTDGNVRKALWRYNASSKKKQYADKVLKAGKHKRVK